MSSSSSTIDVQASQEPAQKPVKAARILDRFKGHKYAPSPTGVDSNLLIMFHGLGDSSAPFFQLGQNLQKTLPQTAVLSLQGKYAVPFLDEGNHWMWWPSFDQFGEMLTAPNPTKTVADIVDLLTHLTTETEKGGCGWSAKHIHLFGFGQGASAALEALVAWTKSSAKLHGELGSIVSTSGSFISHPTLDSPSGTPVLQVYRSKRTVSVSEEEDKSSSKFSSFRKATKNLTLQRLDLAPGASPEEAMPRNQEWDTIMQFWSRFFRHRSTWELKGEAVSLT